METKRKVISAWKKKGPKGQKMEQVVYITTYEDGSKSSRTAHEPAQPKKK